MEVEKEFTEHNVMSRHDATQRDMSRHTLTIKQAADLFAEYGVPRSSRSVQRFCELENLDCIRVKGDRIERYFVDPLSVERYARELKQLENIAHLGTEPARRDASQRDMSRHDAIPEPPPARIPETVREPDHEAFKVRIDVLEKENFQLTIDRAAKEQVIGQMLNDRVAWLNQLTEQSREIGRLEMQVQQLAPPQRDMSRHDATEIAASVAVEETTPEEVTIDAEISPAGTAPAADTAPPARSLWRRIFS